MVAMLLEEVLKASRINVGKRVVLAKRDDTPRNAASTVRSVSFQTDGRAVITGRSDDRVVTETGWSRTLQAVHKGAELTRTDLDRAMASFVMANALPGETEVQATARLMQQRHPVLTQLYAARQSAPATLQPATIAKASGATMKPDDALSALDTLAKQIMARSPGMTYAKAYAQAVTENPHLYKPAHHAMSAQAEKRNAGAAVAKAASAQAAIDAAADRLREKLPGLSHAQAVSKALANDPGLYSNYKAARGS